MYETEQKKERVILVGISLSDAEDVDQSLDELEELARTAGAECVGRVIQKRELIHPGTYVGKGKLERSEISCGRQKQMVLSVMTSCRRHRSAI